ncbi:riboflavin synthase [Solibacillus daqui]|uniref:riboflavin synthase n=1 Tax=Solibacillus daqui TaxID=2912187 RepID=UPI00236580CA|nr:riboflavin synthase [Solibacillus daqui]
MFTGIIEEIGTIEKINMGTDAMQLEIKATKVLSDVQLGDSIAVNGVCLTVTQFSSDRFYADVMPETFHATNLTSLQKGMPVNLERAMHANGRFGGHFVSGHVDGIATIKSKKTISNAIYVDLTVADGLLENCIVKGSITLDGTSLTIFALQKNMLTVSLIPHTSHQSVLGMKKVGEQVNVETDLLGKYVKQHVQAKSSNVTRDFLKRNGF